MATAGHIRSDNKVVQGGIVYYEGQKTDSAAVTPGALVIRDAADGAVKEAGLDALDVIGVADVIFSEKQEVGTDIASGGKPVRVAKGVFLFRGTLKSGQNVAKGARLGVNAGGELYAAASGKPIYAVAEESVDATAAAKPILARFTGEGGTVA